MFIVVGGHSRNIGKTAVTAGLIAAFSDRRWTAMKITQYGHGVCSSAGEPCECDAGDEHPYSLCEESDIRSGTDTARFLAAGAGRALWLRTAQGQLGHAVPAFRQILESSEHLIVESNSLMQFFQPDLYLVVLDFSKEDFKESARRYLDRADAVISLERKKLWPWRKVSPKLSQDKPEFPAKAPHYVTPELVFFVQNYMQKHGKITNFRGESG